MSLAAALIYWLIIALWLAVLAAVGAAFIRNPKTFGTTRLLLTVLLIDTLRNVFENLYFGLYWGAQYGLFPGSIIGVLGNPYLLILPKAVNVLAACAVLGLIVFRWLPLASGERLKADEEIKDKTDALNQEAEDSKRLFDTSLDLILVTDRRGVFTRVSPSALATIGYRPDEMLGRSAADFILPADLEPTRREMKLARTGRFTRNFDTRYVHKNGRVVPLAWSGVWSEPEQKHFFIGRDTSEQKAAQEKLWHLAHHDPLTSLPNRTSLQSELDVLLHDISGSGLNHAIAIIGVDGFKDVNDTLGHSIGDKLLREAAARLISSDGNARAYRLGGDQFVLLMQECGNPLIADEVIQGVLDRFSQKFEIDGHELFVTASAGFAIAPADGSDMDSLLANADLALYDAKASGGRRIRKFVPTMRAKAESRRALDHELRRAWRDREFVLYFQPQLRASDEVVVAAEALLRWNHPERDVLAPGVFIDALAESAISLDVGRWILLTACKTAASWRAKGLGDLRIGVNLFPVHFRQSKLLEDVKDALRESGLPPALLELEITENIALSHDESMLARLEELRAMGVGIALDDFGTGYASLSSLTSYPLNRIKIDRSFVQTIVTGAPEEQSAIVRSILAMARNLKLDVTAEGVETTVQADFLRAEKCQELQGYLFSRPVPSDAFENFLTSHKALVQLAS